MSGLPLRVPAARRFAAEHLQTAAHAGRDPDVDLVAPALPAGAMARRAGLAADVAGAVAGRARLLDLQLERLAGAAEGFLERDRDVRLNVLAAAGAGRATAEAAEEVLEVHGAAAGRLPAAEIAEDRPEEIGEVASVTVLDTRAARLWTGARLRVALPVGAEGVG